MSTTIFAKTRLAPTPSGYLHLGNILSFGMTAAMAKKHQAKILLRIDDLDKVRVNPAYVQDIFDTLNFLGVHWDEGPRSAEEFKNTWSQLHRMDLYNEAINRLRDAGKLFACTCSRMMYAENKCTCPSKQLPFDTPSANWRIFSDKCRVTVKDCSGQMINAELPPDMHNFIVRKKDGYPSYQLASVVDDLHYGVDLIVRGRDLWHSTIAQHFLASELGTGKFGAIAFSHHPLVEDSSGQKLSKSAGATSVKYLRENGKTPGNIFAVISAIAGIHRKANTWQEFTDLLDEHYGA